ncbi:MAG: DUF4167 domain-containing protein [Alphaproteobacteria bacterium]|nr:DUF4167 domain-containing protein [Alphaproteobacteria bacterium]MCW5742998.1 DUF4167 domain-containing protein [Alphaproteobacteria bacterium]
MRPNNQRRQRGRNNGGGGKQKFPSRNQSYDSNGPDVRVRGTAHQIYEKYMALAREATTSGDRILAESYYQYAEHYFRVIAAQGGFVRPSFDRMWDEEGGGEEGAPQGEGAPMEGQGGEGAGEGGQRPEGGEQQQRRYDDRGGYNERQQGYGGERGPGGGYDNRRHEQRRHDDRRYDDRRHDDRRQDDRRSAAAQGDGPRDGGYGDNPGEGATPIPYPPRVRNLSDDPAFAEQPQVDGAPFNGNSVVGPDGAPATAPVPAEGGAEAGEGQGGRGDRQFRPRHPHFRRFRGAQRRERDGGEGGPAPEPAGEPSGGKE